MVTYTQFIENHRRTKKFRSSTPRFEGCPYKYGICVRVGIVKPKKPNSAQRKIAKVRLTNDRQLIAYIPGFGHELKKNSEVMVRGGRVPDLPGVRYHIMRGKKDLQQAEVIKRVNRRSKYGLKNPNNQATELNLRLARKAKRRKELKEGFSIEPYIMRNRVVRIKENINFIINRYDS
jgi:small subunit ribosomal protein S12